MAAQLSGPRLQELYDRLWQAFGSQGWWPGDTPFEVALGAILTQNTNWRNVARVMASLKEAGLMDAAALQAMPLAQLADRLRPAGYYNVKAQRVQHFLDFLSGFRNSMDLLAQEDLDDLRPRLLQVKGVGPETADSILLYALDKPTFVVDAYTFRILHRHFLAPEDFSYEDLRQWFMEHLPPEVAYYQEYHALLVKLGKDFCRPKPRCQGCPLENWP